MDKVINRQTDKHKIKNFPTHRWTSKQKLKRDYKEQIYKQTLFCAENKNTKAQTNK